MVSSGVPCGFQRGSSWVPPPKKRVPCFSDPLFMGVPVITMGPFIIRGERVQNREREESESKTGSEGGREPDQNKE